MSWPNQISVIVPLYNEDESLPELCDWIKRVMEENNYTFEVLMVNDGSTDKSWEVVQDICSKDDRFKGISFQRNNGKSAALNTGFQHCQGEVVITMDADLQDSPDEIPGLYKMIKEDGYDLVSGWKRDRHDPFVKNFTSKIYNGVARWITKVKLHDMNCGLKAYDVNVVKNIEVYGEMHRYIPVISKWKGFNKIGEKVVKHQARKYGTTKFGLERFVYGFLDLLSITFVSKFKRRPMHFFGVWGTLSFMSGLGITIWLIIQKLISLSSGKVYRDITDQPLFFLALVALIIGVQMFLAGFLGEMIALNRPGRNDYLISEKINVKEE